MTPWTVACQDPLSMEFSRQEYWSGLPCTSPVDLPEPGSELGLNLGLLHCRQILYRLSLQGHPWRLPFVTDSWQWWCPSLSQGNNIQGFRYLTSMCLQSYVQPLLTLQSFSSKLCTVWAHTFPISWLIPLVPIQDPVDFISINGSSFFSSLLMSLSLYPCKHLTLRKKLNLHL